MNTQNISKTYTFRHLEQWATGLANQLEVSDAGLRSPSQWLFGLLPSVNSRDANAVLATDPIGDLYWLRPDTYELLRGLEKSNYVVLDLDLSKDSLEPLNLAVGFTNIWLRVQQSCRSPRVLRYRKDNGESLAGVETERRTLAMTGDSRDGIWLLLGGDAAPASLNHYDHNGMRTRLIPLPNAIEAAEIALTSDCQTLIVLDLKPQVDQCENPTAWRLWRIDLCPESIGILYSQVAKTFICRSDSTLEDQDSYPGERVKNLVCNVDYPDFKPSLLAVNAKNHIQLLAAETGELWSLSLPQDSSSRDNAATIIAQSTASIPATYLPLRGLLDHSLSQQSLIVSGNFGLGQLSTLDTAQAIDGEHLPTFITPVLVSPESDQQGWLRADLNILLDPSAALEISVAASDDKALIAEAQELVADERRVPSDTLRRLDKLLPWQEQHKKIYRGIDWPSGRTLRFPLQEITQSHIWLKIRLFPAAKGEISSISEMRVGYPNISYTRFIPAIYQKDPLGARTLRRFLVGLESILGDLNQQIGELSGNIDPQSAPHDWLPVLLRWLGLPAATELPAEQQRQLLQQAAELSRLRGTLEGLRTLLTLVVGRQFSVRDSGAGAAPWVLPTAARASLGPRLGQDTLATIVPARGFSLARTACLGDQALGYAVQRRTEVFQKRGRVLDVRVAVDQNQRKDIKDLLTRYLPYFIPAQCRYQLHFVQAEHLQRKPLLDGELRLLAEPKAQLGRWFKLGGLALPLSSRKREGIIIGRSHLGSGLYF